MPFSCLEPYMATELRAGERDMQHPFRTLGCKPLRHQKIKPPADMHIHFWFRPQAAMIKTCSDEAADKFKEYGTRLELLII